MLFVHQNDETLNQILAWERVCLNDGIVAVKGKQETLVEIARFKQDIENAGFIIN